MLRFFSRPLAEADAVESTSGEVNVQAVSVRPVQSKSAFFSMCLPVHHLPTCTLKDSLLIVGPRPSNKTRQKRVATSSPPRARASLCKPPLQAGWPPPLSLFLGGAATSPSVHPHPTIAPPGCPVGGASGQRSHPPIRPLSARVLVKGDRRTGGPRPWAHTSTVRRPFQSPGLAWLA